MRILEKYRPRYCAIQRLGGLYQLNCLQKKKLRQRSLSELRLYGWNRSLLLTLLNQQIGQNQFVPPCLYRLNQG